MLQGFIESNSFGWIILQHPANEVKQTLMICVLAMHELLEKQTKYLKALSHLGMQQNVMVLCFSSLRDTG